MALPTGLSFYTFVQIAYLVRKRQDPDGKEVPDAGLLDYLAYTVYFPKLAEGPITLPDEVLPELSRDGKVVVFHDDTLDRVCGVHARVDDLTWDELSALRLCGTEERIPLFSEVLKSINGCEALIVELKNGPRNRELCEKTLALLSEYRGNVCIESFNPLIVAWFRFHAPDMVRGQLATTVQNYRDDNITGFKAFVLHNTLLNFLARPQFIAYRVGSRPPLVRLCTRLGALNIGWTSHEPRNEKGRDGVIFEFYRPQQRYL